MAVKDYTTQYPGLLDTAAQLPTVVDNVDDTRASQLNTLKNLIIELETQVGSDLLETTSLRGRLAGITPLPVKVFPNTASFKIYRIEPQPGTGNTCRVPLNDGKIRSFTGFLELDVDGTGEGGLDTGTLAEQIYYVYLIPDAGDDDLLNVVFSNTDPISGGPTGFPAYRYIGALRAFLGTTGWNPIDQLGSIHFYRRTTSWPHLITQAGVTPTASVWNTLSLADGCPVTAGAVSITGGLDHDAAGASILVVATESGVPIYTPSGFATAEPFIQAQGTSMAHMQRTYPYIDGNLYYNWVQVNGPLDYELAITGWDDAFLKSEFLHRAY